MSLLREEGEIRLAEEMEQKMLEIWDDDLHAAWYRRDMKRLRFLLSMGDLIHDSAALGEKWNKRALIPVWVLRLWDKLPEVTKASLRGKFNQC